MGERGATTGCHGTGLRLPALLLGAASCLLIASEALAQRVIHVRAAATGGNNGTSWADAYVDLQPALTAAVSGDEIWIAEGTYRPTATADRTATFRLAPGVALYGGFAGTEAARDPRDVAAHPTILSGEIGAPAADDNSYHVVTCAGSDVVDGITITRGNANHATDPVHQQGGGCTDCRRGRFTRCTWIDNAAADLGGGVGNSGGTWFEDCTFEDNQAAYGGGASVYGGTVFHRSRFVGNVAQHGGGINAIVGGWVIRCTFDGNRANEGGGIYSYYIGAPYTTLIQASTFRGNVATVGGGAWGSFLRFASSIFHGNVAPFGAALWEQNGCQLIACTIVESSGCAVGGSSVSTIASSIVWGNATPFCGTNHIVRYSDVRGGFTGTGNIDLDPLFRDEAAGDFRLTPASPCIDAGNVYDIPRDALDLDRDGDYAEWLPYDHDGRGRFMDHRAVPDTGAGPAPIVDMGATEHPGLADIVCGAGLGPSNANLVAVHDAAGAPTATAFAAYAAGAWGTTVAAGEMVNGGSEEILTGPGPGPTLGPQVRAFTASGVPVAGVSFYAYGTLRYGVNPSAGSFDPDFLREVVTGAGPAGVFGPHVRGFTCDGGAVAALPGFSFFAYATLKYGANVSAGDLDGDGAGDVVTGPGPGAVFGSQLRGFGYRLDRIRPLPGASLDVFPTLRYGLVVATGDHDDDGADGVAAASGPGGASAYEARFMGLVYDGASFTQLPGFLAVAFPGTMYGGRPGLADVDGGGAELLCASGADPAFGSTIAVYAYDGAYLTPAIPSFAPFGAAAYGATVAGGLLGL